MTAMTVVEQAREQLAELTGRRVEGVLGVGRRDGDDGGWEVVLEVLELERVPSTTDVMGMYAVVLDDDGDLVQYQQVRRYSRGQTDEDRR